MKVPGFQILMRVKSHVRAATSSPGLTSDWNAAQQDMPQHCMVRKIFFTRSSELSRGLIW